MDAFNRDDLYEAMLELLVQLKQEKGAGLSHKARSLFDIAEAEYDKPEVYQDDQEAA